MSLEIKKIEDFDRTLLEKVTPYSIFSTEKTIKLITSVFEGNYFFVVYFKEQKPAAILPVNIIDGAVLPIGYYGNDDMFDFSPISFNSPSDFVELMLELEDWTEKENLKLNLREIPALISNLLGKRFKVELDGIIPVTNIDHNLQTRQGKPILKKKHRKEMRRKFNRLTSEGITHKIEKEATKTVELKEKFLDFFSKSAKTEKQSFIQSKPGEYFKQFLDFEEIKFSTMHFNEKLVSILVYFENDKEWVMDESGRKVIYLYNMASDVEFYDYSPGLIHVNSIIMDVIKEGYDEFNFLRGGERYKFEIGANGCRWNVQIKNF